MRLRELFEDGRIVKGVNTTADVDVDEIPRQAEKFGNKVDKDGRPPTLSKKVKGSSTNVAFNLGLAESVAIKFERTDDYDILHIKEKGKNRVEVRGKKGYESGNYDPKDKLHKVLDKLGKAANISDLMNGETVVLNPKHPDGPRAIDTVKNENFADGKKKGKSRPGRVKRAGASCNGSVTSLRKRAKNSSGEKARMYHWCANMKSGRKKK
jgi:hypothetical protein